MQHWLYRIIKSSAWCLEICVPDLVLPADRDILVDCDLDHARQAEVAELIELIELIELAWHRQGLGRSTNMVLMALSSRDDGLPIWRISVS